MRVDNLHLNEYALLQPGRYKGHIFGLKAHQSQPKGGLGGETFPMFLIEVRVDKTESGDELIRPRRLFLDTWPDRAAAIKLSFVAGSDQVAGFEEAKAQAEGWKNAEIILGRPCIVELAHEKYKRKSGQITVDPDTSEETAVMEEATKHAIQRIYPDFSGKILDEEAMDGIDSIERHSAESPDEDMPVADDKPLF